MPAWQFQTADTAIAQGLGTDDANNVQDTTNKEWSWQLRWSPVTSCRQPAMRG